MRTKHDSRVEGTCIHVLHLFAKSGQKIDPDRDLCKPKIQPAAGHVLQISVFNAYDYPRNEEGNQKRDLNGKRRLQEINVSKLRTCLFLDHGSSCYCLLSYSGPFGSWCSSFILPRRTGMRPATGRYTAFFLPRQRANQMTTRLPFGVFPTGRLVALRRDP